VLFKLVYAELFLVFVSVYINWCSTHGSCYRNGRERNQFSCCCDPGIPMVIFMFWLT